jgi:hypothetical protein
MTLANWDRSSPILRVLMPRLNRVAARGRELPVARHQLTCRNPNDVVWHSDKICQGCCDGIISVWNDRKIVDDCVKGQRCDSARAGVLEVDSPRPSTHRNINVIKDRGGPTNLDSFRGRDKCNSAGYAAAASGCESK